MAKPAITVEVLPVGFGDCLLISCAVGTGTWTLLIDTGPDETYPVVRQRLEQIPIGADGHRHIELFVITHIDHDHIGAVGLLLNDKALALKFGDIWFNAPPPKRTTRGVAEGQRLSDLLGSTSTTLPWNVAWSAKPVCTPAAAGGVQMSGDGLPRLTVLSPAPEQLTNLYQVWAKELERLRRKERDPAEPAPRAGRGAGPSLETLARRITSVDAAVPNGSSIAFLLEHAGASVLLCADAFPTVMVPAIKALIERRGLPGVLNVDAVKLSHHGSRANVTQGFLDLVAAKHFIFSTNNAYFGHPNEEAVARVILRGQGATLWFNHDTAQNRRWASAALMRAHGYGIRFPEVDGSGVRLELPS